ncbi:MAG: gliding motility protein GldL [Prevotellaceae bacterium]|nr:gliding motility protein GldL [Prevotellaceae bacterium]
MAKYSKFNIVYRLQKWMDSVAGQTFMNYAYSWGAAIVILGTLFKLTHLPGANFMLFIGMGTEVFVFFISAFDRPFDKTQEGRDLATDSQLAAELAAQATTGNVPAVTSAVVPESVLESKTTAAVNIPSGNTSSTPVSPVAGGTIIIGGGTIGGSSQAAQVPQPTSEAITFAASSSEEKTTTPQIGTPAPAVTPETAQAMEQATSTYVDRLNELNELLLKIGAVSERLSIDSQEMENLNRTLTGIARVYEMQLKSASQQITTQDEINAETRKMAEEIKELNAVYARMINAMTVNIPKQ